MTTDLIGMAQAGNADAFQELIEPHRRELLVHCYRMLGSFQDAEDALQDTLVAAWQALGDFDGRASLRTWLYRIATNRSLNARRSASRRPATEWEWPQIDPPEPTRLGEVAWLEPFPDALREGIDVPFGPEARYEQAESISLAFVTALQVLPPRQVAVLILRDVLGFRATEVAAMLESTVESVTSALKRARATLERHVRDDEPPPHPDSPEERKLVGQLTTAFETSDVDGLVALLTDDVRLAMPPFRLEYIGRDAATRFYATFLARRRRRIIPSSANGQPALAVYTSDESGEVFRATSLLTITLAGEHVAEIIRFDAEVLQHFGLPLELADNRKS